MILAAYLVTGFGVASVYAVALLRGRLFDGPTGRALPLVIASAVFGLVSLWLLLRRQFVAVRVTAALAVVAIIWGWAAAQYPYMLEPDVTIEQAAAGRATMTAMLVSLGIGALLLVPSMALLFVTFQRGHDQDTWSGEARQPTVPPERA
jgi:cytochrome d ubiquinol oxidase subunit II